jgi:hypothetical protein
VSSTGRGIDKAKGRIHIVKEERDRGTDEERGKKHLKVTYLLLVRRKGDRIR